MARTKRRLIAAATAALLASALACVSGGTSHRAAEDGIAGLTLTYRFDNGRTYRAAYAAERVRFELLEPELPDPPAAEFPYLEEVLGRGLFLIVWDDPTYHSTFVVDLERRKLHASSRRVRDDHFFGTARILSAER